MKVQQIPIIPCELISPYKEAYELDKKLGGGNILEFGTERVQYSRIHAPMWLIYITNGL